MTDSPFLSFGEIDKERLVKEVDSLTDRRKFEKHPVPGCSSGIGHKYQVASLIPMPRSISEEGFDVVTFFSVCNRPGCKYRGSVAYGIPRLWELGVDCVLRSPHSAQSDLGKAFEMLESMSPGKLRKIREHISDILRTRQATSRTGCH